jgi:hypothetical protein
VISVDEARKVLAEEAEHLTDKQVKAIIDYLTTLSERVVRGR